MFSHSEVDVLVVSSVRNIENANSQLKHEKVCFIYLFGISYLK
jgi:hypothetical protein